MCIRDRLKVTLFILIFYRCFDARSITPESRESVERLLQERRESFNIKTAKRASQAAAPLASWVTANVKYSHVLEKIRPLEREQANLHRLVLCFK